MKISTSELSDMLLNLSNLICSDSVSEIDLPDDYYWSVLDSDIYNPYKDSTELEMGLGQLTSDWQLLTEKLTGENELSSDQFHALAAILQAVGHHWTDAYLSSLESKPD